jgi:hypothetical protein
LQGAKGDCQKGERLSLKEKDQTIALFASHTFHLDRKNRDNESLLCRAFVGGSRFRNSRHPAADLQGASSV